jgi:hypothetical protein
VSVLVCVCVLACMCASAACVHACVCVRVSLTVLTQQLSGDINTLSVTFSVSSDLTTNATSRLSMLVVAIQGLVKTESEDSNEFAAIVRHNTPMDSAVWKKEPGALYVRLNDTLLGQTPYAMSFKVKNSLVAQSAVVPTIAIGKLLLTPEGNLAFTSDSLLPAVDMHGAEGVAAPLKVFANFTVLRLGQSTASFSAVNTLTLTIATKYGFTLDPSVKLTLSGLIGSITPSGRLQVQSQGIRPEDVVAHWNQTTGTLIYHVNVGNHSLAAEENLILKFNLTNQARPQSSPVVRFWAANISPIWTTVDKSADLEAPLEVAGIVSASLTQSTPSQNVSNTLTATILLQTLLPAQSLLVISGVTGAATTDNENMPISVYRYNATDTPQWSQLAGASSPFTTTAAWSQTLGELRFEVLTPTEPLTSYSISWVIQNPKSRQTTPGNIRISGEGPVSMAPIIPDAGIDHEKPMAINGLEATLLQSEVSIESVNDLSLTVETAMGLYATTLVTLSGLAGSEPVKFNQITEDTLCFLPAICEFPVSVSPSDGRWSEVAQWRRVIINNLVEVHLILRVLEDVPPGVRYVIKFQFRNGAVAQRSPKLFMGCCCASSLTPELVQPGSLDKLKAPLLIAGSSAANISQSSGGQGERNTITLRLSFNLDLLLTDPETVIVVSGLVGSRTASSDSIPVTCSGSIPGAVYIQNAIWKATRTRGTLTMSLREEVQAEEVLTCNFELLNPLSLQPAPEVRVQLTGAITGLLRSTRAISTPHAYS